MKRTLCLMVAAGALAACAPPPTVAEFNGDSVKINTNVFVPAPDAATFNEATRICGQAGKRAEFASTTPGNGFYSHLFLCLDMNAGGGGGSQTIIVR